MFLVRKISMSPIDYRSVHHHRNHIVQDRFPEHKAEQIIISVEVVEHCQDSYRVRGTDERSECPAFFEGEGTLSDARDMTEGVDEHGCAEDCDECA